MATSLVQIRIDDELKAEATMIYEQIKYRYIMLQGCILLQPIFHANGNSPFCAASKRRSTSAQLISFIQFFT